MITKAKFFGGAYENTSITGTITLHPLVGKTWRVGGSSSPALQMHDARTLAVDEIAVIWNAGANTITVKDATGGTIGTLVAGAVKLLHLFDISTQAGGWRLLARSFL